MSKQINSPVAKFPGTVTICDQLFQPQVDVIEDALNLLDGLDPEIKYRTSMFDKGQIPAVLACVEKWELKDYPVPTSPDTVLLSPRKATHELILWIFNEIVAVYLGEKEVPNE